MDKISSEKRSKIMAAIHSKDTKPELIVRRYLHACGFRYRLHHKRLPGHPDIVLRKYRTCIFINGCFWHGHDCHNFRPPLTHTEFWAEKIARNKARDKAQQQELAKMGWHCVTIWECELEKDRQEATLRSLEYTLNHIYLKDHTLPYPKWEEREFDIAAEDLHTQ